MPWKFHFKHAARRSFPIVNTDASFQLFHERMYDVQTQARSLLPTSQFTAGTKKHPENLFPQFVGNS